MKKSDNKIKIGIIGGTSLDDPNILKDSKEIEIASPFGKPSSLIKIGKIKGVDVAILARHGRKHTIMPTNVNNRANIWAFKDLGVTHIIATSACGSLRENIKPGDFVFVDQFIDRTTKRHQTFYEKDCVCHIPMADPFCDELRKVLIKSAKSLGIRSHSKGTVITIEGSRFSSRAESNMYRGWGADVINMSTVPEVVLAREAGICYQVVCMSTDYDCWHESEESVSIDLVLKVMKKNADNVMKLVLDTIPKINFVDCSCKEHIKTSLIGGD